MSQCTGVSEEGKKKLIWNRIWGSSHWSRWLKLVPTGRWSWGSRGGFNIARPLCISASLDLVNTLSLEAHLVPEVEQDGRYTLFRPVSL